MVKNYQIILIIFLSIPICGASEYSYRWVTLKGQRIKKWVISNEQYMSKGWSLASEEKKEYLSDSTVKLVENSKLAMQQKLKTQRLSFKFLFSSLSLNATDTSSGTNEIAVSDLSYGIGLRWTHLWSEKFEFFFNGVLSSYNFSVSRNKTLEKSKLFKLYAGIGLKYKENVNHNYTFEIGINESFILLAISQTKLKIEKALIPVMSISGEHTLMSFDSDYSLGVNWRLGILTPTRRADYSTKLGYYWSVGITSRLSNRVSIGMNYGQQSLKTSVLEQVSKGMFVGAGIGIDF